MPKNPFSQELMEHPGAPGPGNMGVIGVCPMYHQRNRGHQLRQRRMLLVHPHIEFLPVADAGGSMRNFVDGHRFVARGASRE